jgi:Domain of unknown function (DUF4062)
MSFEGDAFISYAHLDNAELIEGRKGWVANLHRALEVRLGQLLGKPPQIWRDPKLAGNDVLAHTLIERIRRVASLISVVSPRYVKSEWARKELSEFYQAAEERGGIRVRNKARIFKVMKTPVPVDMHPPEVRSLLGYEFFKVDPETGKVRELDEIFGPEAQRDFWLRLDDLAHDICCVLEMFEEHQQAATTAAQAQTVFLAETTSDLREQRETIRRDLEQHGHTVLPAYPVPMVLSELETSLREDLKRCSLSIHMVGKNYGVVPEDAVQSLVQIQNELAIERGKLGDFARLLWIPAGLKIENERQKAVVEQLRVDPRMTDNADLLETSLEDLRTVYQEKLQPRHSPERAHSAAMAVAGMVKSLYLMYDKRDAPAVAPYADYFFDRKFEVLHPEFQGDEAELREYHEENLRACDGAVIFYGSTNECWVRRKLREVQKSAGFGRTKPPASTAVIVVSTAAPIDDEWCSQPKTQFRTHEATLISQLEGFSTDPLQAFLSRFTGAGGK